MRKSVLLVVVIVLVFGIYRVGWRSSWTRQDRRPAGCRPFGRARLLAAGFEWQAAGPRELSRQGCAARFLGDLVYALPR